MIHLIDDLVVCLMHLLHFVGTLSQEDLKAAERKFAGFLEQTFKETKK